MAPKASSPVPASAIIPSFFRIPLLYLEPLFAFSGAILVYLNPLQYLGTMTRQTIKSLDAPTHFIYTELAGAWLYIAFMEGIMLRYVDDLKVWKLLSATRAQPDEIATEHYINKDRTAFCSIHYLTSHGVPNIYAIKAIFPNVDTTIQGEQAKAEYKSGSNNTHLTFVDPRIPLDGFAKDANISLDEAKQKLVPAINGEAILLTKAREGDPCPSCGNGKLKLEQAVEIGHTFHLGTRYSVPLEAYVLDTHNESVPIQMGCHGIGVSRLIGAVANLLSDAKGLNWPVAIAPYETVIVPVGSDDITNDAEKVYDIVTREGDAVIDDREQLAGWKLNDADLVGYPFIVVLGRGWKERGKVEVQCRRLGVKEEVGIEELAVRIGECRERL